MKRYVLIFLTLAFMFFTKHAVANCDYDGSQSEMNTCSNDNLEAAQAKLDTLFKNYKMQLMSPEAKEAFDKAQESWTLYAEKSCLFEALPSENGSVYPLIFNLCQINFIEDRIKIIEDYVSCTENGCPHTHESPAQ